MLPLAQRQCGRGCASSRAAEQVAHVPAAGDPFEALGDPNRREILRLLSGGDKPVQEIAAAMPISRPAVSRHLRLLKGAATDCLISRTNARNIAAIAG